MIKSLFSGFNVHFNAQTGCREDYRVKVFRESALISHLIFEILVSNTKYVLNWEFFIGEFIISFRVVFFFKIWWLFNVSFVLWVCSTFVSFGFN